MDILTRKFNFEIVRSTKNWKTRNALGAKLNDSSVDTFTSL